MAAALIVGVVAARVRRRGGRPQVRTRGVRRGVRRPIRRPAGVVVRPSRRRRRNRFTKAIRRLFKLRRGQHRRHIISDRYSRRLASLLTPRQLRELGYDPRKLGGVRRARRLFARDLFNDPRNLWVGPGRENVDLGRRWREGPPNWDFPPKGYRRPKGWERLIPRRRRHLKFFPF